MKIVVGELLTLPPHGKWDGSLPFWLDGKGEGEWRRRNRRGGKGRVETREVLKK